MNFIETLIINIIIMLFPLMMYLFYAMYIQNNKLKTKEIFFDLALISSFYLLVSYNSNNFNKEFAILLDVPLIIAYLKKHNLTSIILSILIVICSGYEYAEIMIVNYILFYILYLYNNKYKKRESFFINFFIIIKVISIYACFWLYQEHIFNNYIKTFLLMFMFVVVINSISYILKKGEEIISLNLNIKEFEHDKQFRTSLFKITHEIKNPIAVAKSYLDMFDFNNNDHEKYIPIIKEEINKILLLLQDFLSMNKIKIEKELLDINMLLEETVQQYEQVLKVHKSKLEYDITDEEIFVEGDYNRLSQVLINIIKNSLEANSKIVKIKTILGKNNIKIIIEDNGEGISEEEMEKIKEPFYTTKKDGTGLGVSLSMEIISAHNGNVEYSSKKNIGTKVIITLPIFTY